MIFDILCFFMLVCYVVGYAIDIIMSKICHLCNNPKRDLDEHSAEFVI